MGARLSNARDFSRKICVAKFKNYETRRKALQHKAILQVLTPYAI